MTAQPPLTAADQATPAPVRAGRAERLIVAGNFASWLGNGIQLTASSVLVLRTENTALAVGWLFVAVAIPPAVLSLYFGHLADRFDRRRLSVLCDVISAIVAATLPIWLFFDGPANVGAYVANFLLAVVAAMFMPASSALMKERVVPERLGRFNANFEISTQAGVLASASIGGFMIQIFGYEPLFIFNAGTFVVSAVCLWATGRRVVAAVTETKEETATADRAAPARPPLTRLGLLYALGNVNITVSNTLLVVLVLQAFERGPGVLGVVDALAGVGILIAAATYKRVSVRTSNLRIALIGFLGNALIIALEPTHLTVLIIGIPFAGLAFGLARISARTMLMSAAEESKAGRVFGATNAVGLGLSAISTVIMSQISDNAGVTYAFLTLALILGIAPTLILGSLRRAPSMIAVEPGLSRSAS